MQYDERKVGIHSNIFYVIGIFLGVGYLVLEPIETRHHEWTPLKPSIIIAIFGYFYLAFCVYYLHKYLNKISNGKYPIDPRRAGLLQATPMYGIYWPVKWTKELFLTINTKREGKRKIINRYGYIIAISHVIGRIDGGIALICIFWSMLKIANLLVKKYEVNGLELFDLKSREIAEKLIIE